MFTLGFGTLGFLFTIIVVDKLLENKIDKKLCDAIIDNKDHYKRKELYDCDIENFEPLFVKWDHEYDWVERHNR